MVDRYENAMEKHGDHDQSDHGNRDGGGSGGEDKGSNNRPAMAPDKAPSKGQSKEAIAEAQKLRSKAEIFEPVITGLIENISSSIGAKFGEVDGKSSLVNRLKSTDSLARKIDQDAENDHAGDRAKAAAALSDSIRYTINVDDNNYTEGVEKTIKALEQTGFKVESVKNFWQAGDPYDGTNIKVSREGTKVELQVHTPSSHRIKEVDLHDDYENYRSNKNNTERRALWDGMVDKAKAISRPANMGKLLTLGTLVTQTFQTAQEAGLVKSTGVDIMWIITREGVALCDILQN
jgi:hypothetical protein